MTNRCRRCRAYGHNSRTCPASEDKVIGMQLEVATVQAVLNRVNSIARACQADNAPLETKAAVPGIGFHERVMVSCYVQGYADGEARRQRREADSGRR